MGVLVVLVVVVVVVVFAVLTPVVDLVIVLVAAATVDADEPPANKIDVMSMISKNAYSNPRSH
jgi:hypothetical protein